MSPTHETLVGGSWTDRGARGTVKVTNPFDGSTVAEVPLCGVEDVKRAMDSAASAARSPLPPSERSHILRAAAGRLRARRTELAELLARESGNPVRGAAVEVDRSAAVLEEAAEESRRISGELVPVDAVAGSEDRLAFTIRVPLGIVGAITPFNGPLLSPAHKVGAAIASGNVAVLKPPPTTPLGAIELARELVASGLPEDHLHVLVGEGDVGQAMIADPRLGMVTFTGSTAVGLQIRRELGLRPALLELGGNAPMIVHEDADVVAAADAAVPGSFGFAGQVCISVQRLLIHRSVHEQFLERFLAGVEALRIGDPIDPDTDVGPMITAEAADRAMATIEAAIDGGATPLAGPRREGSLVWPTVLTGADPGSDAVCQEAFAPLVFVDPYDDIDDALSLANSTDYGLQASVYTNDFELVMRAARSLRFGGIVINDSPRYRVDLMPYGGVKSSGGGREAPRYSIRAMTEEHLIVLKGKP